MVEIFPNKRQQEIIDKQIKAFVILGIAMANDWQERKEKLMNEGGEITYKTAKQYKQEIPELQGVDSAAVDTFIWRSYVTRKTKSVYMREDGTPGYESSFGAVRPQQAEIFFQYCTRVASVKIKDGAIRIPKLGYVKAGNLEKETFKNWLYVTREKGKYYLDNTVTLDYDYPIPEGTYEEDIPW